MRIRRAAWKATVAGGVAFHVRHHTLFCPAGITECDRYFHIASLHDELDSEDWLGLVNPFVEEQLGEVFSTMVPRPDLVSGAGGKYALADPAHQRVLYWLIGVGDSWDSGDGGSVTLQLSAHTGNYDSQWFDPRTGSLTPAGILTGSTQHTLSPPSQEDWVLLLKKL